MSKNICTSIKLRTNDPLILEKELNFIRKNVCYALSQGGGGGSVASVFGRTGTVTAESGDYDFSDIGNTPTTLSGYGITDAQPLDGDLTAIAALSGTGLARKTGANTWTLDSTSYGTGNVTKVGTPANSELGIWTGDGTLGRNANLLWDTDHLMITNSGTDVAAAMFDVGGGVSGISIRVEGAEAFKTFLGRSGVGPVYATLGGDGLPIKIYSDDNHIIFQPNNATSVVFDVAGSAGFGISGTTVQTTAKLQIDSTTKGFLPPRMTQAQREGITLPATGLMVYQTDGTEGLYIKKSGAWALITAA